MPRVSFATPSPRPSSPVEEAHPTDLEEGPQVPLPENPQFKPRFQDLNIFNDEVQAWVPIPLPSLEQDYSDTIPGDDGRGPSFHILTWNIDFSRPNPTTRLEAALSHIHSILTSNDTPATADNTIVLIQELDEECISTFLANTFLRENYALTDISNENWSSSDYYGTVTLVPKSIAERVVCVFRTKFKMSQYGRDALYVDLSWPTTPTPSGFLSPDTSSKDVGDPTIIRIANVHLESLAGRGQQAQRRLQLSSVASFLSCSGVSAGLVGGDMNAISETDFTLPDELGLQDAWIVPGVREEDERLGHTWGYQPLSQWPPRRIDKILFVGGLRVEKPVRVGVGLKVEEDLWVSDHYGLLAAVFVNQ